MLPGRPIALALAVAVAALASAATVADTADPLLVAEGRALAETWCVACHVIGHGTQASALAEAPPFPTLAERPDFDQGALAVALYRPHPVMPNFDIGRRGIRALTAYIHTLGEPAEQKETRGPAGAEDTFAAVGAAASP